MKKTMLTLGLAMCTVATLGASVNQISAAKDPNYGGVVDPGHTIPGELEELDPDFSVDYDENAENIDPDFNVTPGDDTADIIGPDTEMGKDENIDDGFLIDGDEDHTPVPAPEQKPECKPGEGSGEMTGKPSDKNNKVNTTTKGTVASTVVAPEADLNTVNTGDSTQAAVLLGSMTAAAGTIVAVSKKRFAKN